MAIVTYIKRSRGLACVVRLCLNTSMRPLADHDMANDSNGYRIVSSVERAWLLSSLARYSATHCCKLVQHALRASVTM